MSDRALHDRVIRYLTDAPARAAGPVSLPMTPVEAARAGRFANFLARHYYRDRLARSFQYSYGFREQTGRSAEQVADSAEFDAFLPGCVLGSLASAQCVGEMARQYLLATAHITLLWESLVEYEYAFFLQAATSELAPESQFPSRGCSAVLKRFEWRMPEVLTKMGAVRAEISSTELSALHQPVMLLFSRNREGRLFVVEVEDSVASVFSAVDGRRSIEAIASSAGVLPSTAQDVISALANIGAVVVAPPKG